MATDKIFLDDRGHVFTVQIGVDLTSINTVTLEVLKPMRVSSATWVGSITVAGSGTINYVIQSGDLDTAGIWEAQARIWKSNSSYFHGDTFNFEVFSKWT